MKTSSLPFRVFAGAALVAALAAAAGAVTEATLIGPDLQPRRVSLQGMDQGSLSFFDAQRHYASEPVNKYVEIRAIGPGAPAEGGQGEPAALDLADGQRLTGRWLGGQGDGQALQWDHPFLGKVTVNLEDLRALSLSGPPPEAGATAVDRVKLANGDVVEGFVSSVGAGGIEIKPAGGAPAVVLPVERIKSLRLAGTPREEARTNHMMVWLHDSSRLRATEATIADDQLRIKTPLVPAAPGALAEPVVTIPLAKVARIELAGAAGRLVELAGLEASLVSGGDVFGLPLRPRVEKGQIFLHAPVVVKYNLPAGAQRFAAEALLDVAPDEAADAQAWADFEVVLRVDAKEVGRWHITGKEPSATINVPAVGSMMTLELLPGVNGPILDRLRLTGAAVLVREK